MIRWATPMMSSYNFSSCFSVGVVVTVMPLSGNTNPTSSGRFPVWAR